MSDGQVEYIPFEDHRLGRHIRHDERNRNYPVRLVAAAEPTEDISWRLWGRHLYQDSIGACTCFAAGHFVNSNPFRTQVRPKKLFIDSKCFDAYRIATRKDPFQGEWEPTDTGSSGQAACEALIELGYASAYEWAFGFQQGLLAIARGPIMQGTWWTNDMFHPDKDGRAHPTGGDAGGHEYLWRGIEIRSKLTRSQNRSWFRNSWSKPGQPHWGKGGDFYLTWEDHEALLARDGDLVRPVIATV